MTPTSSQLDAIAADGNVIVVAGAGTGKTSTLVERCVSLLARGCSVENILMVTFTEAAAAEMRHRLHERVQRMVAQAAAGAESSRWWREQLALLDTARICTLHSFCLQLVRENFQLLGIDPVVKVLDEQQARLLIEAALDATLEPHYCGPDAASESVRELIRRYGHGEPERIRSLVLSVHRYAQTVAAPERWFAEQLARLNGEGGTLWRGWLHSGACRWAERWLPELESAGARCTNLELCTQALRALQNAEGLQAVGKALQEIQAADELEWPKREKTRLRKPFQKLFEEAGFLASQFASDASDTLLAVDWENVCPSLRALLGLVAAFGTRYTAAKREVGGIDFSDLEQLALRLLRDEGTGQLTAVARQWRGVLTHVFVDECQDINAAQDAILRAVSRAEEEGVQPAGLNTQRPGEGGNRFLVGDVKQSIYQFRLARPGLFLGYERKWARGESGRRILLSDNFRSAPEIIGFVNALFGSLMREEIGGVEYLPLIAGRPWECSAPLAEHDRAVEFHLIPKSIQEGSNEQEEDESTRESAGRTSAFDDLLTVEREARLVAMRLQELHRSGLEIWDKEFGLRRRVEWRDMAVLLRSPANRVEAFAKEFHRCGVPLEAARGGFLQSTEITDLVSLLRLLDNPLQDIPLLAVLRSPLVALTLDELAEIRITSRAKRFWTALQEFHQKRAPREKAAGADGIPDLPQPERSAWCKADAFLSQFEMWRELVRQTSVSQCLERALTDTDYEAVIESGDRGPERLANVRRLVRMVRDYDPYQRQGLLRFLRFVDLLVESEQDLEPAPAQSRNAVRLMSIHRSKGLEFPVVVVACLGARFNLGDLQMDVLLDDEFGLCAKAVSPSSHARHPTLAHWLAADRQKQQRLGEELRLLYVAATRARDRLLLTATDTRNDCEAWEALKPRPFGSAEMLSARSQLDWLLLWLPTVTAAEHWHDDGGSSELIRWQIWRQADLWELEKPEPPDEFSAGCEAAEDEEGAGVIRRIRWQYAHTMATREPAKTSVTALRRKAEEFADEEAVQWAVGSKAAPRRKIGALSLSAAEVGTLHHRFLQRMRLADACDETDVRHQLAAMVEQGTFTPGEAAAVDVTVAARFWQSEVGRQIRGCAGFVRREVPFTARFSPLELAKITGAEMRPELAEEFVVVQGVADLLVVRRDELWLLDFKTDTVGGRELDAKLARYRPQLQLYAAALAGIFGKPVRNCWLHFLSTGATVVV